MLDSTCSCNRRIDIETFLIGFFELRGFSWAIIEFGHDGLSLFFGNGRKEAVLREILSNQGIGVFIEPAFPRAIGMHKEKANNEGLGIGLVVSELLAVI